MIDWSDIDTVLLDMDGTLLDLHFDNHFWLNHLPQRYAETHGRETAGARRYVIRRLTRERGTLNWYCLDYWSRELGLNIMALKHEVKALIALRPYVREFLAHLHDTGKRVVLITNAHRDSLALKLAHTGLATWFDRVLTAHDFGHPKEATDFWHALHQVEPFDRKRTLFIDDTPAVLEAAHAYGIRHLLTLLQPDSRGPMREREALRYPGIHHFDEILPTMEALHERVSS